MWWPLTRPQGFCRGSHDIDYSSTVSGLGGSRLNVCSRRRGRVTSWELSRAASMASPSQSPPPRLPGGSAASRSSCGFAALPVVVCMFLCATPWLVFPFLFLYALYGRSRDVYR